MITPSDATFPSLGPMPGTRNAQVAGVSYRSTQWTPEHLARLMEVLSDGAGALRDLPARRLISAWRATVQDFAEPEPGSLADTLREALTRSTGLSKTGLEVGLSHVFRGVSTRGALDLLASDSSGASLQPAVALMSSNLPGLAVQSMLPALALRRPLLLKSASSEPFFAPAFAAGLIDREPVLRGALAAICWPGGAHDLERVIFEKAERVVAYGDAQTEASLRSRLGSKLIMHGPKLSIAIINVDANLLDSRSQSATSARDRLPSILVDGLARDIALFDQRGCLSIQAIFVLGDDSQTVTHELAESLSRALAGYGHRWPPGPQARSTAAGIRQWRDDAIMGGLWMSALPFADGTVIVTDEPMLRPSPGGRTIRIHPVASTRALLEILEPWRGRLQGAAVAGTQALDLESELRDLGVSRIAAPGALQHPDLSTWHNGGLAPLEAFQGT